GAGMRAFTAGIDLSIAASDPRRFIEFLEAELDALYKPIVQCRVPVIAAVEGIAYATGAEVPMCCDIVYAGDGARFCFPDIRLGLAVATPVWGASKRLNWTRLAELGLTSEEFSAATAYEIGLVTRVIPKGKALQTALETAARIAAQAPLAVEASRKALR